MPGSPIVRDHNASPLIIPAGAVRAPAPAREGELVALRLPPADDKHDTPEKRTATKVKNELLDLEKPVLHGKLQQLAKLGALSDFADTLAAELRTPDHRRQVRAAFLISLICRLDSLRGALSPQTRDGVAIALAEYLGKPDAKLGGGLEKIHGKGARAEYISTGTLSAGALRELIPTLSAERIVPIVKAVGAIFSDGRAKEFQRYCAAEALSGLRRAKSRAAIDAAMPLLAKAILEDRSAFVRHTAAGTVSVIDPRMVGAKERSKMVTTLIKALGDEKDVRHRAGVALGMMAIHPTDAARAAPALTAAFKAGQPVWALTALYQLSRNIRSDKLAASIVPELMDGLKMKPNQPNAGPRSLNHYLYAAKTLGELGPHLGRSRSEVTAELIKGLTEALDGRYRAPGLPGLGEAGHVIGPSATALGRMGREGAAAIPVLTRLLGSAGGRVEAARSIGTLFEHTRSMADRKAALSALIALVGPSDPAIIGETARGTLRSLHAAKSLTSAEIRHCVSTLRDLSTERTTPAATKKMAEELLAVFAPRK